jgi:hypothetical protein
LTEANIIDDVVDEFLPKCYVAPYYSKTGKTVTLGNSIKPKKTKDRPSVKINCPDVQETTGLTIVLTDPDAPSKENPKWGEMCHWIAKTTGVSSDSVFEVREEEKDIVRCTKSSNNFIPRMLKFFVQTKPQAHRQRRANTVGSSLFLSFCPRFLFTKYQIPLTESSDSLEPTFKR